MENRKSILTSIKKLLGIEESDTSFDTDIIIHINSALRTITQVGVGPQEGFFIEDSTVTWGDFVADKFLAETIASFVYIKVRLVFDTPASPTVVEALKESASEDLWRIRYWGEEH